MFLIPLKDQNKSDAKYTLHYEVECDEK
ncbi:Protein of unknown function [Bacillus cereus]|nr:Protein of unknown function [Bacillus cereus]